MRVRVKICGLTRAADATDAVRLGADVVGFVFWPASPRAISIERAIVISRDLPPLVIRVGVFVNCPPDEVRGVVERVPLDVVQLHGDEQVEDYAGVGARLIRAVTLTNDRDVARAAALPADVMPLVDAVDRVKRGGTGREANWTLARALAVQRPIMLAGGLAADNVAEAVRCVRPWAIDVSSGVEDRPGIKDAGRIAALFAAVAGQEQEMEGP